MKKGFTLVLALLLVLTMAGCGGKAATYEDLKPWLDDFYALNKDVEDAFRIPENLPMDCFRVEGTGRTLQDQEVDLFAGKEMRAGETIAFEDPENLKSIHIVVYGVLDGETYPAMTWDVDIPGHSTEIGYE